MSIFTALCTYGDSTGTEEHKINEEIDGEENTLANADLDINTLRMEVIA